MTPCPSADGLLAFASGGLTDDRSASIEAHIDSCAECRQALSNLARGDVPPKLGRYRLDTVLGSGGMGIVYRAWDPELARAVAIKVVRRATDDATGRARLVREAQALARLSHPNVCHVYDVDTEGDEVWVAMELIDGVTLRQWTGDVLEVLLGAAEGLAAAHTAGLVHRDVKPENVLVTRQGRAIVTDFGLARVGDAVDPNASTLSTDPHLTQSGAIAGTPAYLAPEQLSGGPIDARVDQFAWAVMAWELLTGARPFPAVLAVRLDAIRAGVTPSARLPAPIAAALARAMAAAPRDRFPSMRELIDALGARPKLRSRRAWLVAAAGGLVVLGVGGLALGTHPSYYEATAVMHYVPTDAAVREVKVPSQPVPAFERPAPAPAPVPVPAPVPPPTKRLVQRPSSSTAPITQKLVVALDPPLRRGNAIATLDASCHLPYDAAHPDPALPQPIADWGKVVRAERVVVKLGDRDVSLGLVEVAGQRANYQFSDELGALGRVEAKVGELLVVCRDELHTEPVDIYTLPPSWSGPLWSMGSVVPVSAPPRITELASLAPLHVDERRVRAGKLDPARRYLVRALVGAADGDRWQMTGWTLEVPSGIRGARLVATGKRLWIVVEEPVLEAQPTGKPHVVWRAAAVIDDLFP